MAAEDRQAQIEACRSLSEVGVTTGSIGAPVGKAAVAASAAAAVYTVTAAMDVAALREEVARLGTQVHALEEQLGRGGLQELESKVDNLGRSFAVLKEQMHTMVRERQLDLLRERKESEQRCESSTSISPDRNSSTVAIAAMRQELDDYRARWVQLARQVEEQCRATSMCVSAVAELRGDSLPRQTSGNSSSSTTIIPAEVSALRNELSEQLSDQLLKTVAEAMSDARRDMRELARESAHKAAKEAAKIAANETAREVAHIAAFEAVEATAEKAREAAREVACAEMAIRCDERGSPAPGSSIVMWKELREMLISAITTVEEKQAALTSDMRVVQNELRSEISAAVAAISKENDETGRAVASCQQEIQGRYAELISITNSHTSRYSKLRLQMEAMRQDGVPGPLTQSRALVAPAEQVAILEKGLVSLNSKLQRVERQLWGDSPVAVENSRVEVLGKHSPLLSSDAIKATTAESALSTQKAAEELRVGIRSDLARLAVSQVVAPCDGCEDCKPVFHQHLLTLASALGEEFEDVHSKKIAEMAFFLGEEFAKVFEENDKESEALANEIRGSYTQLLNVVRELERRQASHAAKLEAIQRSHSSVPPLNGEAPPQVVAMPETTFDIEGFHKEHQTRLDSMAKILGEEFEATHNVHLTEALQALGEEFDSVQEPLNIWLEDLQKNQDALHGGLVSYVEESRQNHARLEQKLEEVLQRQTAHASELEALGGKEEPSLHWARIAESLGEEFDKLHSEKHQPIETCLSNLRANQLSLASAVQELQRQNGIPRGSSGSSLEELKNQLAKLSKVVQDMIEGQLPDTFVVDMADQKLQVQVNSCDTASPKGRVQQSPGVNSQESTSDSKRERHGKRSPDGMSDALSDMGSHLDNGGEWDRLHDKVVSLPVELEALRTENGAKVLAEQPEPLAELRNGQERLLTIVEDLLERQECDKKFADFLEDFKPQNFDRLSGIVATMQERQSSLASELEALRQRYIKPMEDRFEDSGSRASPHKNADLPQVLPVTNGVRDELDKLLGTCDVTDVIVKMAGLPKELEAMRRDHNIKVAEMAACLGEEFHHASVTMHADMACALGEEFDKVYGENTQLLQCRLEAMRETQSTLQAKLAELAEIVFRQEYCSSVAEFANPADNTNSEKSNSLTQFESLCCFVRNEVALKVEALRQEFATGPSVMQQELAISCKAAQESNEAQLTRLYQVMQEQAVSLEDLRRRHRAEVERTTSRRSLDTTSTQFSAPTASAPVVADTMTDRETLLVSEDVLVSDRGAEVAANTIMVNETALASQEAEREAEEDLHQRSRCDSGFFTLGVEQCEMIAHGLDSDLTRAALRKTMDEELKRARMALEGMPNFEGLSQNSVDRASSFDGSQSFLVPEFGDMEEIRLREKWPLLHEGPGKRAERSEDVSGSAEEQAAVANQSQSKAPSNATVSTALDKVASRPNTTLASSNHSRSASTVPAPGLTAPDVTTLTAPTNATSNPLSKTAMEQLGPEKVVVAIPEVAKT